MEPYSVPCRGCGEPVAHTWRKERWCSERCKQRRLKDERLLEMDAALNSPARLRQVVVAHYGRAIELARGREELRRQRVEMDEAGL